MTPQEPRGGGTSGPHYLIFILGISVFALLLLAYQVIAPLDADTKAILEYADTGVCVLFLIDFLITLARSENRTRYFFTWGLIDLASSIPMVNFFRVGRLARIVRIVRVLRGVRAARTLALAVLEHRAQSGFLAAALVSIILIVFGSVSVLEFEKVPEANIRGPQDALWWSIVTLTTVGYGDRYPVTAEGRIIAAILMIAGVGLFGTLSGFVASWFLAPGEKKQENEVEQLRQEIRSLRESVDKLVDSKEAT